MAKGYNKAVIMGNLTKDPDVNHSDQRTRTRFTVAVNRTWKGRPVLVEGRLHTSSYEAKDGTGKRYSTDVIASGVTFLGGNKSEGDRSGGYAPDTRDEDFPMDMSSVRSDEDADIPF